MELKDKEYTLEEVMELIEDIEGDFMLHIRLEGRDGEEEGGV